MGVIRAASPSCLRSHVTQASFFILSLRCFVIYIFMFHRLGAGDLLIGGVFLRQPANGITLLSCGL